MVLGIDAGGSTTKIVGIGNGEIRSPQFIVAADPVTSLFGAFGKYVHDNGIALSDIERVMITGVGSASLSGQLYGLPTEKVDEFSANALGARYGSGLEEMVVVSMGTGTSFIRVSGDSYEHLGGLAIGGGTLAGLSRLMLRTSDIAKTISMAEAGDVSKVDLLIGDISRDDIPGLPKSATASNFGKADASASQEDAAAGIVNMVLQTIGSASNFIARNTGVKDFVLIGNLALLPQCPALFEKIGELYGLKFRIPDMPEYRTAIGAALGGI